MRRQVQRQQHHQQACLSFPHQPIHLFILGHQHLLLPSPHSHPHHLLVPDTLLSCYLGSTIAFHANFVLFSPPNVQLARCVLCTLPHVPPRTDISEPVMVASVGKPDSPVRCCASLESIRSVAQAFHPP